MSRDPLVPLVVTLEELELVYEPSLYGSLG